MISYQIISSVEKNECIPTVSTILEILDECTWNLKEEYLPVFKRNLENSYEASINFKILIPSLAKLNFYGQYLTSVYIYYNTPQLRFKWLKYTKEEKENLLGILMDDNTFSSNEKLSTKELNLLNKEMERVSLRISKKLNELNKRYVCICVNSKKVIDSNLKVS